MTALLHALRNWYRRKVYRPGRVLSGFIACDVRRDIRIVSVERLDDGIVIGQLRTNNVMYLAKHLIEEQDFGEPTALEIASMWEWTGRPWGGLPDGKSIADIRHHENSRGAPNQASEGIPRKFGNPQD